jgi:hypothetical protein
MMLSIRHAYRFGDFLVHITHTPKANTHNGRIERERDILREYTTVFPTTKKTTAHNTTHTSGIDPGIITPERSYLGLACCDNYSALVDCFNKARIGQRHTIDDTSIGCLRYPFPDVSNQIMDTLW